MSDEPVIVNPDPTAAQLLSGLRSLAVFLAGFGLLSKLPPEVVAFVQSDAFIGAASTLIGAGAFIWGQINIRIQKAKLVAAATAAPDAKFVVTEPKK